jgi:hypothetical protein
MVLIFADILGPKASCQCHQLNQYNKTDVSISSGQRNLMKTYHNEANSGGITKIALKFFLDIFGQSRWTHKIAKF